MLEMVGVYPGKQWVRRFISRYPDIRSMAQNDVYALLIRPRMKAQHLLQVLQQPVIHSPHKCRLSRKLGNISSFHIQTIRRIIIPDPRLSTLRGMRHQPYILSSTSDSLQSVVPSSMNLNNYNLNFYGNLRQMRHIYCRLFT
jgi:hypothetical protein